ncbi:MAG: pyridoxal phosphate-dependent aminotransferase [Flavobacteriales bacterium]|nr:pyridoxal phosphate-dependent aminotransferase [Flavobacteriales bacterium]
MPQLSENTFLMPASPIRKLVPYANEAKAKGKKVYHLNIGQPDIAMPKEVIEAFNKLELQNISYAPSDGYQSYKDKIVTYYASHKILISSSDVLVTTGGSEALEFTFLTCFNPGDELIIPEPFYANYLGFAAATGVKIKPIISTLDSGFALPAMQDFERLITPYTKGIMICNPNNPTGYLYSKEEIKQLGKLAKKHDLFLIADEVYREFCYDGHEHYSLLNLPDMEENVIVVDSVSKRYSLCGARVGALVSKNTDVIEQGLKYAQARLSPPTLGQIAAEAAMDCGDEYFENVKAEYVKRRDLVVKRLNEMKGVKCPTPKGAFYTVAQLPIDNADNFCQWLLSDFSLNDETVMFAPAAGFYSNLISGQKQIRIAYVLNLDDLNKALDCLDEALKVYPNRID